MVRHNLQFQSTTTTVVSPRPSGTEPPDLSTAQSNLQVVISQPETHFQNFPRRNHPLAAEKSPQTPTGIKARKSSITTAPRQTLLIFQLNRHHQRLPSASQRHCYRYRSTARVNHSTHRPNPLPLLRPSFASISKIEKVSNKKTKVRKEISGIRLIVLGRKKKQKGREKIKRKRKGRKRK